MASDVGLSKRLAWLLRRAGAVEGVPLDDAGYASVDDVLSHRSFRSATVGDIRRVVDTNSKQRYELRDDGRLLIRARQGHSVPVGNLQLAPVAADDCQRLGRIVHGTRRRAWDSIRLQGLRPMRRTHIHLAAVDRCEDPTSQPEAGVGVGGLRAGSDIFICVDLPAALRDGIPFHESSNGVILSEGNADGCIPPKYFEEVWQKRPMRLIFKDGEPFD